MRRTNGYVFPASHRAGDTPGALPMGARLRLKAGKNIYLEKPLAHDAEHARRIAGTVETAGVRFMVGHILRFDPRYVQVYREAAPEKLGAPIHLRAKRNGIRATAARLGRNSSILFYMGVHDVDALQWIARSEISEVYARKVEMLGSGNEDALYAVVSFKNGAIGLIDYSWAWPNGLINGYRAALEVVGTNSAAYLDVTDHRDLGLAVAGDVGDLVLAERVVDADAGRGGVEGPGVGDHVLGTVAGHDGDKLAVTNSQRLEPGGRLMHHLPILPPGETLPVSRLPVDGRLIAVLLGVTVEKVDDGLAFYHRVDLGSFGESVLVVHVSSRVVMPRFRPF